MAKAVVIYIGILPRPILNTQLREILCKIGDIVAGVIAVHFKEASCRACITLIVFKYTVTYHGTVKIHSVRNENLDVIVGFLV